MTIKERIFWITILVALIGDKTIELYRSFDMVIDPIGTTLKIVVMIIFAIELIKNYLLPKAKVY